MALYNLFVKRMIKNKDSHQGKEILESATKLFYENGYNDTHLDYVADACGITKQLISYYYGSKAELAIAVDDNYSILNKNTINFKTYKYFYGMEFFDLQVNTAIEIKLESMLLLNDEKAMRFYKEIAAIDPKYYGDSNILFYEAHDRRYHLDIDRSRDELNMLAIASGMAGQALLIAYDDGAFCCTQQQLLDYSIEVLYKLMNISAERIKEINEESNKIIKMLNFSFKPYFIIE